VFSKIKVDSPDSGTSAWTEIFLLYPVTGASIAHKLLARGLKTCLNFKNDSMASTLDYIASVNASASQLSHVQPMTVQDVYALVTLMGLYLSEASGHQKAYKELLAHIDDGVTPSRSRRCNTRSSGSLILVPLVLLRSPTPATLPFATTAVLVAVTLVAKHLALRARVPPLGRIHQAAPAALVALSLLRLLLSTPTGVTKASPTNTTLSPPSFRATT
jgi:hypothetical protein